MIILIIIVIIKIIIINNNNNKNDNNNNNNNNSGNSSNDSNRTLWGDRYLLYPLRFMALHGAQAVKQQLDKRYLLVGILLYIYMCSHKHATHMPTYTHSHPHIRSLRVQRGENTVVKLTYPPVKNPWAIMCRPQHECPVICYKFTKVTCVIGNGSVFASMVRIRGVWNQMMCRKKRVAQCKLETKHLKQHKKVNKT